MITPFAPTIRDTMPSRCLTTHDRGAHMNTSCDFAHNLEVQP